MTARIEPARYTLRLRQPLALAGATHTERHGLLLAWRDGDGPAGYGEVAPLPGLHRESLDEASVAVDGAARALAGTDVRDLEELHRALATTPAAALPSVVFGIEMAWLAHRARALGRPPAHLLSARPADRIEVASLFDGGARDAEQAVGSSALARCPVLKVKVGRRSLGEERAVLRVLERGLGAHTRLRLDGNRALSLATATTLLAGFDPQRFEYFEEPLRDPAELPALFARTGVGTALDETLREPDRASLWGARGVASWVVKPALHRGFHGTLALAERAAAQGISCAVSACGESGLGLWALAQLAAALPGDRRAAGLGTDAWLAEDLIDPPFASRDGSVAIADWTAEPAPFRLHRELDAARGAH
jgi:O-succinylbenzoate synthase